MSMKRTCGAKQNTTHFCSMLPKTRRCADPDCSGDGSFVCCWLSGEMPYGKLFSCADVGGPLLLDENPRSELELSRVGGDADESDRLRAAPIPSSADARDEEPTEYEEAMPFTAGDDACDAFVEAVVALGDETS